MSTNRSKSMNALTRDELLVAASLFYRMSKFKEFRTHNDCQDTYKSLVQALSLETHCVKVLVTFIQKHEKDGKLTPVKKAGPRDSPFNFCGNLDVYYNEDSTIESKGCRSSRSALDVMMLRAVFAGDEETLSHIAFCTFFCKDNIKNEGFLIPKEFTIPPEVEALSSQMDRTRFFADAFKLDKDEALLLDTAYRFNHLLGLDNLQEQHRRRRDYLDFDDNDEPENILVQSYAHCMEMDEKDVKALLRKDRKLRSYSIMSKDGKLATSVQACIRAGNIDTYFCDLLKEDRRGNSYKLNSYAIQEDISALAVRLLKGGDGINLLLYGSAESGKTEYARSLAKAAGLTPYMFRNELELDESTLRRFSYSICFPQMSSSLIRSIAYSKLHPLPMSKELRVELMNLCGRYHVTGASVDNMVKTVRGMDLSDGNKDEVIGDVRRVLEANSALLYGKKKMRDTVRESYDLSVLNSTMPAEDIVAMVKNALAYDERHEGASGIRMLFYGLSGTGKTEFARYIAGTLDKQILLKRASDILDCYVGENEKNIRKAFDEAEASGAILLFDEADSFFADRSSAHRSWERTMVNEFLTQMEEFSGILICTTNLRKIMDPAMQRRFHILTEFKPLTGEGIQKLLGRFFADLSFTDRDIRTLAGYGSVTPGDFGALEGKIRFMPQDKISPAMIIDELCEMQEEKDCAGGMRIGFAS